MDARTDERLKRAIAAVVVGNVLEWYDFVVFSYFAMIIAKNFFSAVDPAALLSTFLTFGIGFIARPIGALVIGWFGDRHGRKAALLLTISLMALGTVAIGLVPSYASIGVAAPILLAFARLMQGFSVGGEWGNATAYIVETAPKGRRGYYASFQQSSVVAGLLLGSAIAAILNTVLEPAAVESWGWRIPFLLGGIIGPVGLYIRRNINETPAYLKMTREPFAVDRDRALSLLKTAQAFGFMIVWAVMFYIFLAYMPTFTQKYAGLDGTAALWSNTAGLLLLMVAIPPLGHLSDKIGRRPLLLASCAAFILLPYPLLNIMLDGASLGTIVTIQLVMALAIALYSGPGAAAIAEIFPTRARTTLLSVANGTAVAIFGGFAPYIAERLIQATGSPLAPTYYVIASAVVSAAVIVSMRETAHDNLG